MRGDGLVVFLILAAAAGLPAARAQSTSQLTDIARAVQQVRELYRSERFDALEHTLDSMLASTQRFRSGATLATISGGKGGEVGLARGGASEATTETGCMAFSMCSLQIVVAPRGQTLGSRDRCKTARTATRVGRPT